MAATRKPRVKKPLTPDQAAYADLVSFVKNNKLEYASRRTRIGNYGDRRQFGVLSLLPILRRNAIPQREKKGYF